MDKVARESLNKLTEMVEAIAESFEDSKDAKFDKEFEEFKENFEQEFLSAKPTTLTAREKYEQRRAEYAKRWRCY